MPALAVSAGAASADAAGESASSTMFALAQVISDTAKIVRENNHAAVALSIRVCDMVDAVADGSRCVGNLTHRGESLGGISEFVEVLWQTKTELDRISKQNYIAQVLHKNGDRARLEDCSSTLTNAFQVLMLNLRIDLSVSAKLGMQRAFESDALGMLEALSIAEGPPHSPVPRLPSPPQLFFGRDREVRQIADCLTDSPVAGHCAILGGPGMGKTSLARSVLHHPAVLSRFGARRFFVPCDAAEGQTACLRYIASALEISAMSVPSIQRALRFRLSSDGPSLLVLDNFESAWEAETQRADAEATLRFLADIPALSLLVTLRGMERPQGVAWSRPFMVPLSPIPPDASKQLFLSISGIDDSEIKFERLLAHLEDIPLAVVLVANLAQYNGIDTLLDDWDRQSTAILTITSGSSRLTSLDVSIALSLDCSRMNAAPSADTLLALLSLLPDGASISDITRWMVNYEHRDLSTLLAVALVSRPSAGRVSVLAPIRGYMLKHRAPSSDQSMPLYEHYFSLLGVVDREQMFVSRNSFVEAILPELGNIEFLVRRALRSGSGGVLSGAVAATVKLCRINIDIGAGTDTFEMLLSALEVAERENLQEATADLVRHWGTMSFNFGRPGDPRQLWRRALEIYQALGLPSKAFTASSLLPVYNDAELAVAESIVLCDGPDVANDPRKLAWAFNCLGLAYRRKEMPRQALSAYRRSLCVMENADIRSDEALSRSMYAIGCCQIALGNNADAVATFDDLLTHHVESIGPDVVADCYMQLGSILCEQGYTARGLPHLKSAFTIYQKRGSLAVYLVLFYLCRAHLAVYDVGSAGAALQAASHWGSGQNVHSAYILLANADLAMHDGDLESARALIDGAHRVYGNRDADKYYQYTQCLPMDLLYAAGTISAMEGGVDEACTSFIVLAATLRGDAQVVQPLLRLAEVWECDCEEGERLIDAVMLPMLRMDARLDLAKALLHSAKLALRRGLPNLSRHRAESALAHFQRLDNNQGIIDVDEFIHLLPKIR